MFTATPQPQNISGDYSGTMTDGQNGNSTATGTLAQTGSNAGGSIVSTGGNQTLTYQMAVAIDSNDRITGSMVTDLPAGAQCSFAFTGAYDATTNVLSGNYTAVSGCSGDTGSFALTQTCSARPDALRRRMGTPAQC
jgi:hypothetical protein